MNGLQELVRAVDAKIKKDALYEAAKENVFYWFNLNMKVAQYSQRVRRGEELTSEESEEYQEAVYGGCDFNHRQIEKLIADGVISDEREFGRKCQEVERLLYEKLDERIKPA